MVETVLSVKIRYCQLSSYGHSRKWTALLTVTVFNSPFHFFPLFSYGINSCKRTALLTDTFSNSKGVHFKRVDCNWRIYNTNLPPNMPDTREKPATINWDKFQVKYHNSEHDKSGELVQDYIKTIFETCVDGETAEGCRGSLIAIQRQLWHEGFFLLLIGRQETMQQVGQQWVTNKERLNKLSSRQSSKHIIP